MWYNISTVKEVKREVDTMLKVIGKIIYVVIILIGVWTTLSFFDIIVDNNTHSPQHSPYNFFVMGCELTEKIN